MPASRWRWRPLARPPVRQGLLVVVAFGLLNALLTLENLAPGLGVKLSPRLSFDLCLGVLAMTLWVAWRGRLGPRLLGALAAGCTVLVVARYLEVTAAAVYGRPLQLYWDGRHALEVAQLAVAGWPAWQVVMAGAAVVAGVVALHAVVRWCLATLADALRGHRPRPWVLTAGTALTVSFAVHPYVGHDTRWFFAMPVGPTLWQQTLTLPTDWAPAWLPALGAQARPPLAASPRFDGNLAALHGADVLLIFAEAYGATTFDDPVLAAAVAPSRARLSAALAASGRPVVSARVRSPTFGGGSWLAHAALLSGVDTQRPGDHERLLASDRPTLVQHFARHGYRTVAWMPGIQRPWPEGSFYGFERRADAHTLGYEALGFGHWRIPDQAALALLQAQELTDATHAEPAAGAAWETVGMARRAARADAPAVSTPGASEPGHPGDSRTRLGAGAGVGAGVGVGAGTGAGAGEPAVPRRPRFVVYPTVSSHAPFLPLPPLKDASVDLLSADAYSAADVAAAEAVPVSWLAPRTAYARAIGYTHDWLAAFLAGPARDDLLVIVIGDHQPIASVSGKEASWDVPVHVIGRHPRLLARLEAAGFVRGLEPGAATRGGMHELTPLLVRAFDDPYPKDVGREARAPGR
jgi:hypothetical protein